MSIEQSRIRNFCIIAHIDHGKSTLADRLLELTGTIADRDMRDQLLDQMDLEQEKGITIKLQPVRMRYQPEIEDENLKENKSDSDLKTDGLDESQGSGDARSEAHEEVRRTSPAADDTANRQEPQQVTSSDGKQDEAANGFQLNLIDTPGHVDFSYEVSRSLAAVEGALLVVDGAQGMEAQTLANVYLAMEANLEIIPVINKIDLPAARPEKVTEDIVNQLGCEPEDVLKVSAKTGEGVTQIPPALINRLPPPSGHVDRPARALIFDAIYDEYRGVILYVRVVDGSLEAEVDLKLIAQQVTTESSEVGIFNPKQQSQASLQAGEIGYVVTNLKSVADAPVGDTVTTRETPAEQPLPGYQPVKPYVFAGFFPGSGDQLKPLRKALNNLQLNDAALQFTPERSQVLGFGFRIGFLGLLHMEIVKERLEREYDLDLIVTSPSTNYQVELTDGSLETIRLATELPDPSQIETIKEPWVKGEVIVPSEYVGNVIQLINSIRGQQGAINYLDETIALINFEAPLANLLTKFYDRLKSVTQGYGTYNYEMAGFREEDLVRLDVLVAKDIVDSLSQIVHRDEAENRGRNIVEKLKDIIPRQQFEVPVQAAIGGNIIARENIKALRKNVAGDLYGGDITRKRKLRERQKEGKKRMKKVGNVDIPPEAFQVLLQQD